MEIWGFRQQHSWFQPGYGPDWCSPVQNWPARRDQVRCLPQSLEHRQGAIFLGPTGVAAAPSTLLLTCGRVSSSLLGDAILCPKRTAGSRGLSRETKSRNSQRGEKNKPHSVGAYFLSFPLHTCISDLISFNDQLSFLFYFLPHPVICGILVP